MIGWLGCCGSIRAVGLGQEGDWMDDTEFDSTRSSTVYKLKEAPWIPGCYRAGPSACDVVDLSFEELAGHFGLSDVVNPCTAAAPRRLWEFHEFLCDRYLGTHAQAGLTDTLGDILCGMARALVVVLVRLANRRPAPSPE